MRKKIARRNPINEEDLMPFEDKINPERFQVLILSAQGYSDAQMAAYLGLSRGTIKSRLSRGRIDLKKLLVLEETEIKEMYDGAAA